MFLLLISFIGGVLTVLAPCILPLLPVIIGGSLTGGEGSIFNTKKALTIIISLGVSVILFTLLLKVSTLFITIPPYVWTLISGGIILILGIVTIFPALWESKFLARLSSKSNMMMGAGNKKNSFVGDIIIGASLGPVFSTCSPTYFIVLATVLPVNPALGMIYLLAYTIGLCLSLLIVSLVGQKVLTKLDIAADPKGLFKRVLGIIFVLVGLAILSGFDKTLETSITGAGFFDVTKIEQKLLQTGSTNESVNERSAQDIQNSNPEPISTSTLISNNSSTHTTTSSSTTQAIGIAKPTFLTLAEKALKYKKTPELSSIDGYINTGGTPITLAGLRGKVVLLDIWTYSCINCQRTIPYVNSWYSKYKDQGFEIVGLHTPEFGFEKVQSNVQKAVEGFDIKYPVVLDNEYATWTALGNQFWPRKYLIDIDGYIVYDHIGEGSYGDTEKAIQHALAERDARLGISVSASHMPTGMVTPTGVLGFDETHVKSPETYFGSSRNLHLANGNPLIGGEQQFTIPTDIAPNKLYLGGTWNISSEYAQNTSASSSIVFNYDAKNVYMAAGSDQGVDVEIYRDDVLVQKLTIKDEKLYPLISGGDYGRHTLRIVVPKARLKAFTFTFG
jgi:cytochrome c biogenesis protein CcdA/thiol-disulfide isomerase/thioredoxin